MRTFLLTIVACLLAGCVSSTRVREANCLGSLMMDVWHAEDELKSVEIAWRAAQQIRYDRSLAGGESLLSSLLVNSTRPPSAPVALVPRQDGSADRLRDGSEERALYRQVGAARTKHRETVDWYGRVAHRVQTRLEEDDMLYPVLGTLVTSTAIFFYPVIRWNVKSILWDGVDPDAEDDPVQRFCATRLDRDASAGRAEFHN